MQDRGRVALRAVGVTGNRFGQLLVSVPAKDVGRLRITRLGRPAERLSDRALIERGDHEEAGEEDLAGVIGIRVNSRITGTRRRRKVRRRPAAFTSSVT